LREKSEETFRKMSAKNGNLYCLFALKIGILFDYFDEVWLRSTFLGSKKFVSLVFFKVLFLTFQRSSLAFWPRRKNIVPLRPRTRWLFQQLYQKQIKNRVFEGNLVISQWRRRNSNNSKQIEIETVKPNFGRNDHSLNLDTDQLNRGLPRIHFGLFEKSLAQLLG